jgi:hypothetical protein
MNGVSALQRNLKKETTVSEHTRKQGLARHQAFQWFDLGLPHLLNWEK